MLSVQTMKVTIINWWKTGLRVIFVSLLHPILLTAAELAKHKSTSFLGVYFTGLFLFYAFLQLVPFLWSVLRGDPMAIIANDVGLTIQAFRKSRRIPWTQIATVEKSQMPSDKSLVDVVVLRDAVGGIKAQFTRGLQESATLKKEYDDLEAVITKRVGKKGIVASAPLQTGPTQTSFTLSTQYKILGLASLLLWLPCAYFSWNARTGGPLVGTGFLCFAALSLVLVFLDKCYEIDERGVRNLGIFKREELSWEEISQVGLLQGAMSLIFVGEHRHISVPGLGQWEKGGELMQFLQMQIKHYNIGWEPNATPQWTKDTLVKVRTKSASF